VNIEEHLDLHNAVIVGIARKLAWWYRLPRHAWKDLAQEARLELIRAHNGNYDHDRASLLTYAYQGIQWRLEDVAQDMIKRTTPADGLMFDQLATTEEDDVTFGDPDIQRAWNMIERNGQILWIAGPA
jgi:hypothetical protein